MSLQTNMAAPMRKVSLASVFPNLYRISAYNTPKSHSFAPAMHATFTRANLSTQTCRQQPRLSTISANNFYVSSQPSLSSLFKCKHSFPFNRSEFTFAKNFSTLGRHSPMKDAGLLPVASSNILQARGVKDTRGQGSLGGSSRSSKDPELEELMQSLNEGRLPPEKTVDPAEDIHGWMVRMANENGYLSWCRNAYISTVVSVTAFVQEAHIPYAKEVSVLFLLIGSLNMIGGTGSYLHYTLQLRRSLHMSRFSFVYHVGFAVTHMLMFLTAAMMYMGYVDEDDEEDSEFEKDEHKQRKSKKV